MKNIKLIIVIASLLLIVASATLSLLRHQHINKTGVVVCDAVECSPVIWHGKPILIYGTRKTDTDCGLCVRDLTTGADVASFAHGFSFASAIVDGDTLHVWASRGTAKDWYQEIWHWTTNDLETWTSGIALVPAAGEHFFNTSVMRDPQSWIMAYESNLPGQFRFRLARSNDLEHWMPMHISFAGINAEYTACPMIRYHAPYYYVIYLHAPVKGHNGWLSWCARSTDLANWENAPQPFIEAGKGEGCNNSDVDMFEQNGQTRIFYLDGDQETWANICSATFVGSEKTLLESQF